MTMKKLMLALVCGTFAAVAFGTTYYVSPAGGGDGSSPDSPCTFPEGVKKATSDGDVVKMLAGDYKPSKLDSSRAAYVVITTTITIEGSVDAPETVKFACEGPADYRMIFATKPITLRGFTVSNFYNPAEQPAMLRFQDFTSGTALVEKCHFVSMKTATKWNAHTIYIGPGKGGTVRFKDCTFKDGFAEANTFTTGIYHKGGTLRVEDCTFDNMYSRSNGGAIFSDSDAEALYVERCTFENCSEGLSSAPTPATGGGAIGATVPYAFISKSTFDACKTSANSGYGSAIRLMANNTSQVADILDCRFLNCEAVGKGAVSIYGGTCTVSRCVFSGNTAKSGSAISSDHASSVMIISDCSFTDNSATQNDWPSNVQPGGTVYLNGINNEIVRCAFTNNMVAACGSAILLYGNMNSGIQTGLVDRCVFTGGSDGRGGAVYFDAKYGSLLVRNSLFENNATTAEASPAITVRMSGPETLIDNCTFVGNGSSTKNNDKCAPVNAAGAATVRNCVFWNNTRSDGKKLALSVSGTKTFSNLAYDCTTAPAGEGHVPLTASPFKDAANGDYTLAKKVNGEKNPCLGAGVKLDWMTKDSLDLAGNPRLRGDDIVDLGCYEYFQKSGLYLILR